LARFGQADGVGLVGLVGKVGQHDGGLAGLAARIPAGEGQHLRLVIDMKYVDVLPAQARRVAGPVAAQGNQVAVKVHQALALLGVLPLQGLAVHKRAIGQKLLALKQHGDAGGREHQRRA